MSHLTEEIRRQQGEISPPPLWSGTIAETPLNVLTLIPVVVPAFAGSLQLGPCPWQPRVQPVSVDVSEPGQIAHVSSAAEAAHLLILAEVLLPTRGDACLVAFDENDQPWIVCWWPAP